MDNNSFQNFVMQWLESLFNGAVNLIDKIINANGTYEAVNDGADGYKKVVVNVPNTYAAGDEGKVVDNGALVAQTAHATITVNGNYDTTLNDSVEVDVFTPTLESKSITANGTYTPAVGKAWNEVVVNVPISTPKVTGTFTLLSDAKPPTITHNLNTQKIAVLIVPHYSIAAHSGYKAYCVEYINMYEYIKDETWVLDYTNYNSTRFPDVVSVNINDTINNSPYYPKVSAGQGSPWTTQSGYWNGDYNGQYNYVHVLTNNTYTYDDILCSGTYRYIIFSLE